MLPDLTIAELGPIAATCVGGGWTVRVLGLTGRGGTIGEAVADALRLSDRNN